MINIPSNGQFSIHNIPFGIYSHHPGDERRPCSAIGDYIIDLKALAELASFNGPCLKDCAQSVFSNVHNTAVTVLLYILEHVKCIHVFGT